MPAVRYQIRFEGRLPTIDEIARQFRDATGLDLTVKPYGVISYDLRSAVLRCDAELVLKPTAQLMFFRLGLGYFEWALLGALHRLGGQLGRNYSFPKYTNVRWADLNWYRKWLHRMGYPP